MVWQVKIEDLYINVKLEEFQPEDKVEKNGKNGFEYLKMDRGRKP